MSRYDRNKSKKSNKTTFIIAILVSCFIGISGTFFIMKNFTGLKEAESLIPDDAATSEIVISEEIPEAELYPLEIESDLTVAPEALENNISKPIDQLAASGLPDLLSSDGFVRESLIKLAPGIDQFLSADQFVRKYVLIANDFAQGQRITKHVSFLRFDEPFAVEQGENGLYIAAKSFRRYNNLAQTIQAMDAKATVMVYQKIRPLMLQVFAEFGYPKEITLESVIKKAVGEILAVPVVDGQVAVVRPSVYYKFADAQLEALNPVQKQIIRMGPENTRTIQNKCREFLVELAKAGDLETVK